jgi:hypothetical protein
MTKPRYKEIVPGDLEEDIILASTENASVMGLPISVVYDPHPENAWSEDGLKDLVIAQAFFIEHHICLVVTDGPKQ